MSWASKSTGTQRNKTEKVAQTIYHRRRLLNRAGSQQSDWAMAEEIVRSPLRRILFAINNHPASQNVKLIIWGACRCILFSLPKLEWTKLLAVPLALAVATSIITGQFQREANQNAVLKAYFDRLEELTFNQNLLAEKSNQGAIVLARGRTVAALRELDLSRRTQLIAFLQASNLTGTDKQGNEPVISFKGQNLANLDLQNISLGKFDFRRTNLQNATLSEVFLGNADMRRANLSYADLRDAFLANANIRRANLDAVDMRGANLYQADMRHAKLTKAKMHRVNMVEADMRRANLSDANLSDSLLANANMHRVKLHKANLYGAKGWTDEQLSKALLCETKLPKKSRLDPNKNCPK